MAERFKHNPPDFYTGSCSCGGVQYQVKGPLSDVVACHCSTCRKTTGHYFASSNVARKDLNLVESQALTWYQSSDSAARGFCRLCGGQMFFSPTGSESISICAGTIDLPTKLKIRAHIYVDDKADYVKLDDSLPCYSQSDK